jgi:ComF family protein
MSSLASPQSSVLRLFAQSALDLLFPPHCAVCEKPLEAHEFVCAACLTQIELVTPPYCRCGCALAESDICPDCVSRLWYFDLARSYGYYEEENTLGKLIKALKYGGEWALVHPLSQFLLKISEEFSDHIDAVTFIPMTRRKERERGFNQAKLLAGAFAKHFHLPLIEALKKTRETRPQASLKSNERLTNLEAAFQLASPPECANIVLIDDVVTTGTTVETASKALREGGYEKIFVVTLARVKTAYDRVNL